MRHTRAPQEGCGSSRVTCGRRKAARWVRLAVLAVLLASLGVSHDAHAQDPSTLAPGVERSSSFPKQSMVGPSQNIDKSQPLYLQGDELIYDTGGNKVIAKGNVEIYYNNYILTADQVVYDQSANTLTAVGNVMLKEPNGNVVRADRYTLTDDFRDGFVSQLSVVAADDTRIAAEKATRRGGNTTVFVQSNGITVVDTKNPGWGAPILAKIQELSPKPITTIVNTHSHGDHVSGNVEFPATVDIIVQENTATV